MYLSYTHLSYHALANVYRDLRDTNSLVNIYKKLVTVAPTADNKNILADTLGDAARLFTFSFTFTFFI